VKTHPNAGTSKYSSSASFAQHLRLWFLADQRQFATQQDFAQALGVSFEALQQWMRGSSFPTEPLCDKLYEATQLRCFSPEGRLDARREHEQIIDERGTSRTDSSAHILAA
jgi:hypothetical protein